MSQHILVLGIGNVLFADEGIGVHLLHYIEQKYRFDGPHRLDFIDGGTLAHALIPLITQYDQLVVIDTVHSTEGQVGNVYFFDFDKVPHHIDFQGSAHEVEMLQTLNMMEMVGDRPPTHILGVIPEVLEAMSFELSASVLAAVPLMERALLDHLASIGMTATRVSCPDIRAVAQRSCAQEACDEVAL
ncbi:HyaD/HybD family hydrogenase maturation endopeptidase [Ferrimonas balearica]|uniref:HyaD/HybD family hydrogenase maturation endopeptidase n=1 Tax=Ferrimonas balearica TaxID=44012 RepID=UPI001C58438D|nr:HyaD/HybD family hydrogenase maturation endopeptidase [Ferrimonas balearica]MBW3139665.1 HyaD/HybD family hydrogenase maturation endopeptidase [Ferrimonas balearica]MBW3164691.1 HyaD/HybD family hydrogenase maturation endopeptidase [Ferrimonas balearica]MBY5980447.1 HyaD/HybD family hydrogenase maturation endopeptidase [Ferrimonas balearica]MBY6107229.1 HyaD/HybD family hydrogenase maturation endopeptidase [Ferrimonas balearica]MBY6224217.1 HyaD/HybD family hydrogenase maturation endopeptid